jgi:hypothetical protein
VNAGALYVPSTSPYQGLEELEYPVHDSTPVIHVRAHLLPGAEDQREHREHLNWVQYHFNEVLLQE